MYCTVCFMFLLSLMVLLSRGYMNTAESVNTIGHVAEAGSLLESLMEGDFEAVLLSPVVLDLLSGDASYSEGEEIEAYLERRVLLYLTGGTDDDRPNR